MIDRPNASLSSQRTTGGAKPSWVSPPEKDPNEYLPEIGKQILRAIRAGADPVLAAQAYGISAEKLRVWNERDKQFAEAVEFALAVAAEQHMLTLIKARRKNWRASARWLELMDPEQWGSPAQRRKAMRGQRPEAPAPEFRPAPTWEQSVAAAKQLLAERDAKQGSEEQTSSPEPASPDTRSEIKPFPSPPPSRRDGSQAAATHIRPGWLTIDEPLEEL